MSLLRLKAEVGEEAANSVIHKIQGVFFFFFFFFYIMHFCCMLEWVNWVTSKANSFIHRFQMKIRSPYVKCLAICFITALITEANKYKAGGWRTPPRKTLQRGCSRGVRCPCMQHISATMFVIIRSISHALGVNAQRDTFSSLKALALKQTSIHTWGDDVSLSWAFNKMIRTPTIESFYMTFGGRKLLVFLLEC